MELNETGKIVIYQTKSGQAKLEVKISDDTIWLTQLQISYLFNVDRTVVTKHINNIFNTRELLKESNVQKMHIAKSDKPVSFYNLDVIISVGYRVNSIQGTQFRIWATNILRKHLVDGYTINKQRIKEVESKYL